MSIPTRDFELDIWEKPFGQLNLVQYESAGRAVRFRLLDHGKPFDVTGKTVLLEMQKPDHNIVVMSCDVVDAAEGIVKATIVSQAVVLGGEAMAQIRVSDDGQLSKSFGIRVLIAESINADGIAESTTEFTALQDLIVEAQSWENKIDELDDRVSQIITTPAGTVNAEEIIDARDGETALGDRLDRMEQAIEDNEGRGISSTVTTYGTSASGTDSGTVSVWESSPVAVAQGEYLWTKTVDTYTDATTATRYSVARMGVDGDVDDLAGAGRTTETVKGNADDIALKANSTDLSNLAGTGRTTETVKANADAIANRARTTNNGALQETPGKNRFYPLLANAAGTLLARHQVERWTGSAWVSAADNIGFGGGAMQNNIGTASVAVGHLALQNNAGHNCSGFGYQALQNNTGISSVGFGQQSLQNNTGAGSVGLGRASLQNSDGGIAIGYESMQNSVGQYSTGIGYQALQNNTGNYSVGIGFRSLSTNDTSGNVALGYAANSVFQENVDASKVCHASDIDTALNRATITGHGFGAANAAVNVKYASTTGTAIGGLTVGGIFQVRIIDADTVEFIRGSMPLTLSSQGSGTHTFTPQFAYSNTACIGNGTVPNRSNQVVLGNTSVDTVKMGGAPRTPASATAPGVRGETCWDANYFYICVATSIWKRIPLESWA